MPQELLEKDGEERANLLRLIAIGVFYSIELLNYYGLQLPGLDIPKSKDIDIWFHQTVTTIAVAWSFLCLVVWYLDRKNISNFYIKYISTVVDLILITFVLLLADGPKSPLCVIYLVMVVLSALRFNLPLVRLSTCGAILSYFVITLNAKWYRAHLAIPHYWILIFLVSIVLTGVILGQMLRKVRPLHA